MRDCKVAAIIIAVLGCVMGYFFSLQVLFLITIVGAIIFIFSWRESGNDLTPLSFLIMSAVVILITPMWITYLFAAGHVFHFLQFLGHFFPMYILRH
jgi:hypothetical protein